MLKTIKNLRQSNYKIRVIYKRRFLVMEHGKAKDALMSRRDAEYLWGADWVHHLQNRGGLTRIEMKTPDGRELVGESYCNNSDCYKKVEGRDIALSRALALV